MDRIFSKTPEKLMSNRYNSFKQEGSNDAAETDPNSSSNAGSDHPENMISKPIPEESEEKNGESEQKPPESEEVAENVEKAEEETPPEIHYTLESVSVDIDRFLSTFSVTKDQAEETAPKAQENKEKHEPDQDKMEKHEEDGKTEVKGEEDVAKEEVTATATATIEIEIPVFVDKFLDLVEEKISKRDQSSEGRVKWTHDADDDTSFLVAVNRISNLAKSFVELKSHPTHGTLVNRIEAIQQRAMSYLEDEFRLLLEDFKSVEQVDPNHDVKGKQHESEHHGSEEHQPESEEIVDCFLGYSNEIVSNLNKIAMEMIFGGYKSECCQVYLVVRRHAFDNLLNKIGFEKLSIDEAHKMPWEALEREIPLWNATFKECTTIYFLKELQLAEAVFANHKSISDSLFGSIARCVMMQLLNFAEGVAMTKRSAEKVFKILDMYETLRDCLPAAESLLAGEFQHDIKSEGHNVQCRIGESAICIFCDLENNIRAETGKTPVAGGAVHPLTRYIMNYLKYAGEYKATLEHVFKEHSKIERADSTSRPRNFQESNAQNYYQNNNNNDQIESPFSKQMMRLMELLDSNLEAKSKLYKDIALCSIFMMNNGRYILQKVKGSAEINEAVGDTWCRKKSSDVRNYHKSYQRETWGKVLGCLGHEGLQVNGKVVKPVLKERFKGFNMMFDEIHKTQSTWVVSDDQLQSELRVSISAVVIPAYRSFLGRFSQYLTPGRQYEKYIKYQPEDIENYLDELFDGNTQSNSKKRP